MIKAPTVPPGTRIQPSQIAGILGLPHYGNVYYVDPNSGSDSLNDGSTWDNALKTVGAAIAKCTASNHDVIINSPTGGSGRTSETTAVTWKNFTHYIGNAAPVVQDNRAGIGFSTGGSLTMGANGCIFKNLTFFSSADIDETVSITGSYNRFDHVDFKGTFNATSADSTPWRALNINGGQENYFYKCTLGGDTYTRGVANATLEVEGAASRNVFDQCRFRMHADTANTPLHVLFTGTSAIDRWIEFKDCNFYSFWTNNGDQIAANMDLSAQTATGHVLMTGINTSYGADDWEASASGRMFFPTFEAQDAGAYFGLMKTQS